MSVRAATAADTADFRELWEEFHQAPGWVRETWDTIQPYVLQSISDGLLVLAEDGGRAVGFVLAEIDDRNPALGVLVDVYVRPEVRGRGLARDMVVRAAARLLELGAVRLTVEAGLDDGAAPARALYEGLGLRPHTVNLAGDLAAVASGEAAPDEGRSFGSVHVQTDDTGAVERAVRQFVPRLPGSSRGSTVIGPRNGWTTVYDELADRDPEALRRLARELSDRLGAVAVAIGVEESAVVRFVLFERGRVMDEYLSVPEFRGPLPPGDAIALRANPTVVARLTGADPALVRHVARTAASPSELPPAEELIAEIGEALGIEGAERGYTGDDE